MKLKTFEQNGIELKYYFQPAKVTPSSGKLLVVLTNCWERDGHLDFVLSLGDVRETPKLFLSSSIDYRYGFYQNKKQLVRFTRDGRSFDRLLSQAVLRE